MKVDGLGSSCLVGWLDGLLHGRLSDWLYFRLDYSILNWLFC